ncbi:MAG: CoB--CoM heterodisulfide reductase 2 iron-sulfur subunit D [Promethearchaeota archaeon]|nr:MAG: CoB--CoM heterodisulfide reductase 2 iron-sulfur subunit D [Candidatus Lokiarchaeota archaeon]
MTEISVPEGIMGKEYVQLAFDHCIKCSTCKFSYKGFTSSCPSGENFLFESFWASGRIRTTRGLLLGELEWTQDLKDVIFACPTCGACMDACQAPHADYIVDIIESLREVAVKEIGPADNQEKLIERATNPEMWNPYGEPNSDNEKLKQEYNLPDKAEWVYFIGCTSNYRQKSLRDATLRLLKKAGIDFTLIDEHCCTSPMIRTGQVENSKEFMRYNIEKINEAGATKVISSCAGCYRTLKKDFEKFGEDYDFKVYHTVELLKKLFDEGKLKIKSDYNKAITYHDPCHLGRHMGIYEIPREVYKKIPGITFVEMERNRNHSWCCGAGGGVKIGYPDWAINISKERLDEANKTGAEVISSTCPFCKTNLSDANNQFEYGFEVLDLVEILDSLEIEVSD